MYKIQCIIKEFSLDTKKQILQKYINIYVLVLMTELAK